MTSPRLMPLKAVAKGLPAPLRDSAYRAWGLAHGQWPTALADIVQPWLTRNPVTFNEKIRYRLAHDRREVLTELADKVKAHQYASRRIDPDLMVALLAVGTQAADVPWMDLPREYAAKVNHASGGVIVVSDCADTELRLPSPGDPMEWRRYHVRAEQADPVRLSALIDGWLARPYRWNAGSCPEWAYRNIERRVLVEQYCGMPTALPGKFCVFCTDGQARAYFFMVMQGPDIRLASVQYFLADEAQVAAETAGLDTAQLVRVVGASQMLAEGLDMVRVDWNVGSDGPRFNELTWYPGGGIADFEGHRWLSGEEYMARMASSWRLP